MKNLIKKLFSRNQKEIKTEQELRGEFQSRYHHFCLLLENDRKAQECIARLETTLLGESSFNMGFVHRNLADITTATFQMIKHLTHLSPNKYDLLYGRFKALQEEISNSLDIKETKRSNSLTQKIHQISRLDTYNVGEKMARLGEVTQRLGIKTAPGFVITAAAYHQFMDHNSLGEDISRMIQSTDFTDETSMFQLSSSIQQIVIKAELPENLFHEILMQFDTLESKHHNIHVAVRSSALGEDSETISFAGQYKSLLNVSRDEILLAYKTVVASKYSQKAMTYRLARGLKDQDIAMCVGIMEMVDAIAGGVVSTSEVMVSQGNNVSIYSAWGLPKTVVEGACDVDMYNVSRDKKHPEITENIADKHARYVSHSDEGTIFIENEEEKRRSSSLTNQQVLNITEISLQIEEYFNCSQDIEWAINNKNDFILLQSRPLVRSTAPVTDKPQKRTQITPHSIMSGGSTASPGTACGAVYIAHSQADLLLFPDQGVLIAKQALPSWAPLLNKATAVITEMGSPAGHLASIARESGIPAIFGLKEACSTLNKDQIITVDATNQRIYAGKTSSLINAQSRPTSSIKGSPVYLTLSKISKHITPLHLQEADSPEFHANNCSSLHDIIRFCHEKAVCEMFAFGKKTQFPQGSAKQLHSGGAKQFWILNLDDGFDKSVVGDRVEIENITSIPMLALWHGMHETPWQGPPPLNTRGFMSVLFEATANPALEPTTASHYSLKNYFMVSKNYVSLQSRFGFHFCEVEALVSSRDSQNYATFRFQGGAANKKRRILRAQLVASLLEEFDFSVKIQQDSLSARIEGFNKADMEARLRIIGHLIIHTRQLDMIMTDQQLAAQHKSQLHNDLSKLMFHKG